MAEALVTSVIEKLKDPVLNEVYFLRSVAGKVDSVQDKLNWIKSVLRDAESRSNKEEVFKLWVEKIREVAYRIEDAIDIYLVEIEGDRMIGFDLIACIKWVYIGLIMKHIALHNLGVELDNIETTLKEIKENREYFKVDGQSGSSGGKTKHSGKLTLPKYHHESNIVGLETDKEAIVRKLLDPQNPPLHVISVVGTPGLGKTTLARKIFNSAEVKKNFDIPFWVSVSQEGDVSSILKKMLVTIQKVEKNENNQENEKDRDDDEYLVEKINTFLKKKRFLIILDDVWSETLWPEIRGIFSDNEMICGRVVITTRDLNVAQKAQSEHYKLRYLETEESKMLLYKVSFPYQKPPKELDTVATEIAKKCGGLPLAIVVIGGQLYMEHSYSEWRKVAESMDWQGSDCMKTLSASYNDMSIVLKTCFMYLASFPEDDLIDAHSLVRMWVADDVVPDEKAAGKCLEQLDQRCLIVVHTRSYDGSVEKFCVHDLLRELAIEKANENKFLSVFTKHNLNQSSFNDARRASLQSCTFGQSITRNTQNERILMRNSNKKLRFLMVFHEPLPDCSGFRLLKVLKVHNCRISFRKLKKWCEELIHLRHLEFRSCNIETGEIPKSIGHLKNLLTLDCTGTTIDKVPESLWGITTLKHLKFSWSKTPLPSADQPNLETLEHVTLEPPRITDQLYGCNCFPNLRVLTLYYNGEWVATLLKELNQLVCLKIVWDENFWLDPNTINMSALPSYPKLRCLHLKCKTTAYIDFEKHFWPPHLTELSLEYIVFNKKDTMRDLENLKSLEILEITRGGFNEEDVALTCSDGGFPQLQQLMLSGFKSVKEFSTALGAMPMLKKFQMKYFRGLKKIPELQHLSMLREFEWTYAPYTEEEIRAIRQENQNNFSFTFKI